MFCIFLLLLLYCYEYCYYINSYRSLEMMKQQDCLSYSYEKKVSILNSKSINVNLKHFGQSLNAILLPVTIYAPWVVHKEIFTKQIHGAKLLWNVCFYLTDSVLLCPFLHYYFFSFTLLWITPLSILAYINKTKPVHLSIWPWIHRDLHGPI